MSIRKILYSKHGYTLPELLTVILILSVLATIGLFYINSFRKVAFDTTIEYDLKGFKKSQMLFAMDNGQYAGSPGQFIRNDGIPSDFWLPDFPMSTGVSIKIISTPDPFIVEGRHIKSKSVYTYNVETEELTRN